VTSVIAVASLGGTITMTGSGGVVPSLTADDLLSAVPGIPPSISVRAETLFAKPGASLSFADIAAALDWARSAVATGADGVILIQGPDTLEETSYLLDLYWDLPQPLILTGAMRSPQQAGADGPANILAALVTAASAESRDRGVLVVMNDEVHAASRVRKSDTTALAAFVSAPERSQPGRFSRRAVIGKVACPQRLRSVTLRRRPRARSAADRCT
jgi:L-asparaginase